jgi:hypothetical protein
MFKLYLARTVDRALYADEQVLVGIFDSIAAAAEALGDQFRFCDVVSAVKNQPPSAEFLHDELLAAAYRQQFIQPL